MARALGLLRAARATGAVEENTRVPAGFRSRRSRALGDFSLAPGTVIWKRDDDVPFQTIYHTSGQGPMSEPTALPGPGAGPACGLQSPYLLDIGAGTGLTP